MLDKLFKGVFLVVFGAIVATGLVITFPKYRQAAALEQERAELERRIDLKNEEIAEVRTMQKRFVEDREFVEALARKDNRAFPGEIVFVFGSN